MELEDRRINDCQHAFGHNIRISEQSAAIEQHSYWTQFRGHASRNRQASFMVNGAPTSDIRSQRVSSRTPSPGAAPRRSRSPLGQSGPSAGRRKSQRLEDQQSAQHSQGQEPLVVEAQPESSRQSHDAGLEPEISTDGAQSVAEAVVPKIPSHGTITVSLDRRPPLEVRTRVSIPRLTVRVIITDSEPSEPALTTSAVEFGTLHALVSLWSADGRLASPHAMPPMLTGRKDATLANTVSTHSSERRAEATFSDLAITWPGHYRIRISIMETPLPGRDEDSDNSIGSPRQLLSIETRPIHAHGFAPIGPR